MTVLAKEKCRVSKKRIILKKMMLMHFYSELSVLTNHVLNALSYSIFGDITCRLWIVFNDAASNVARRFQEKYYNYIFFNEQHLKTWLASNNRKSSLARFRSFIIFPFKQKSWTLFWKSLFIYNSLECLGTNEILGKYFFSRWLKASTPNTIGRWLALNHAGLYSPDWPREKSIEI